MNFCTSIANSLHQKLPNKSLVTGKFSKIEITEAKAEINKRTLIGQAKSINSLVGKVFAVIGVIALYAATGLILAIVDAARSASTTEATNLLQQKRKATLLKVAGGTVITLAAGALLYKGIPLLKGEQGDRLYVNPPVEPLNSSITGNSSNTTCPIDGEPLPLAKDPQVPSSIFTALTGNATLTETLKKATKTTKAHFTGVNPVMDGILGASLLAVTGATLIGGLFLKNTPPVISFQELQEIYRDVNTHKTPAELKGIKKKIIDFYKYSPDKQNVATLASDFESYFGLKNLTKETRTQRAAVTQEMLEQKTEKARLILNKLFSHNEVQSYLRTSTGQESHRTIGLGFLRQTGVINNNQVQAMLNSENPSEDGLDNLLAQCNDQLDYVSAIKKTINLTFKGVAPIHAQTLPLLTAVVLKVIAQQPNPKGLNSIYGGCPILTPMGRKISAELRTLHASNNPDTEYNERDLIRSVFYPNDEGDRIEIPAGPAYTTLLQTKTIIDQNSEKLNHIFNED